MRCFAIAVVLTLSSIPAIGEVFVFEAPTVAPVIRVDAWGAVRVTGTASRTLSMTVTTTGRGPATANDRRQPAGMKLAEGTIFVWSDVAADIDLRVPRDAQLSVRSFRWGDVTVVNVCGDIEVTAHEGGVHLQAIGGAAMAHAGNGGVRAQFAWSSAHPAALTSMYGPIEISLREGIRVLPRLRTDEGTIRSDLPWEQALQPGSRTAATEGLPTLLAYTRFGSVTVRANSQLSTCR